MRMDRKWIAPAIGGLVVLAAGIVGLSSLMRGSTDETALLTTPTQEVQSQPISEAQMTTEAQSQAGQAASAQTGTMAVDPFHNLTIESISTTVDETSGILLNAQVSIPDGCETGFEVRQFFGDAPNVWRYDIRRTAVPRDTPCTSEPLKASLEIQVEQQYLAAVTETPDYSEVYLLFNDVAYYRLIKMLSERQENNQKVMVAVWGNLQVMERHDMLIRSAEIRPQNRLGADSSNENSLIVLAGASDGCRAQPISLIRTEDKTLQVSLFRLLEPLAICPAVMQPPREVRIMLPVLDQNEALIDGVYQIAVNDYPTFEHEFIRGVSSDDSLDSSGGIGGRVQQTVAVGSAEALILESFPPQVNIVVRGDHPDGCGVAIQETRTQEGNTITIRLYREIPSDVACTMVITPYEHVITLGALEAGEYTVIINGYEVKFRL